jgi:hypothetical protein
MDHFHFVEFLHWYDRLTVQAKERKIDEDEGESFLLTLRNPLYK